MRKVFYTPRVIIILIFWWAILIAVLSECTTPTNKTGDSFYLNHNDTVDYVGLATCASCHEDKAKTFLHTGMGQSFHFATKQKSSADFAKVHLVYDTLNNLYYKPFWKGNDLFFHEYRLEGSDTIHSRVEKIDYIIGSGQHTNSHLILRNGFVYQAPLTWYSQQKHWSLPPGFERGNNTKFSRIINEECMSCHNAMPEVEKGSDNKFTSIGTGIDCERCHGPGELHVNLRLKGKSIKSKEGIDRTIVNPSNLSWQKQVDLCQRCHLQGNAVLHADKSFKDFKPGMILSDYFDVFMPNHENEESGFIMASHAQRLQKSRCFIKSNGGKAGLSLTCITCHDPHVSVTETSNKHFNEACVSCHPKDDACKGPIHLIKKNDNNCVKCHMPQSGTSDIPHVTVHDHNISKPISQPLPQKGKLKGLYCINNDHPTPETTIKAYLSYYEKFDQNKLYLEEARKLLNQNNHPELEIYYWYLWGNNQKVIETAKVKTKTQSDAWNNYRIGQSYLNINNYSQAELYIRKALQLQPVNFEFIYKLSVACHNSGKAIEEEQLLKEVIAYNPNHTQALNNLGFLYFKAGEMSKANRYYTLSLHTNPDFLPLLKNLFDYYQANSNRAKAVQMAKRIIQLEPETKVLKDFLISNK